LWSLTDLLEGTGWFERLWLVLMGQQQAELEGKGEQHLQNNASQRTVKMEI